MTQENESLDIANIQIVYLETKLEAEREKVRRLTELVSKILKAKRSATMYLANPCDKNEHYPSIYISYEVESWFQSLEKEIEEA